MRALISQTTMKNDTANTNESQIQALTPVQAEAEGLIAQAIDRNVPVETMEKLLAMRRELRAEKAKEAFDSAMANFQAKCPIIEKKTTAGSAGYSYKYATLDHIVSQVRGLLAQNGFSYTFDTRKSDHSFVTFCHVKHIGGHTETSQFEIAIDSGARMNISQKDGAASSYGKRYAFCNAFGILTGDEDTDARVNGNGHEESHKTALGVAVNNCALCHAPAGRMHATNCQALTP